MELLRENMDAAEVYMVSRRQYVTRSRGMEGDVVVDIRNEAIESAMRAKGVQDQWACLLKVRRVFHHFLAERKQ